MAICSRGREGNNHRFRLPVILQPTRRLSTSTSHRHHYPHSQWRRGGYVRWPNKSPRWQLTLPHHASGLPRNNPPPDVPRKHRHSTVQHIWTTPRPPAASRPRRLAPDRIRIAKSEFQDMLHSSTTRRSDSPRASPPHLVPKKEVGWRPCCDYGVRYTRTVPDQCPVRHIAVFANHFAFRKIISTIDFVKAYHQIPVYPTTLSRQPSSHPSDSSCFRICLSASKMTRKNSAFHR